MITTDVKKSIKPCLAALALLGLIIWGYKQYQNHQQPILLAPSVVVQKPKSTVMTQYITQTGTLVAYNSVDLVARIEGFLEAIEFTDGAFVKKGQELFIIEPQPYLNKLIESQATVTSKKASFAYSKIEQERQNKMFKQNAASLNSVQEWQTRVLQSQADVDQSTASASSAAITYSYTHIQAPFDGRIGRHLIDIGNLVGNGEATKLATIEQIDLIYAYFNLNELDFFKVRELARANGMTPDDINSIPVYVSLQNNNDFSHKGFLNFVNTGLNTSSGTMEFRALLSNKDFDLLPGFFVQVRVPIQAPKPQLTVPETAVQYDQIGAYLYVVDDTNTIVSKRVITGSNNNDNYIAITQGLLDTDNVVVSGLQNATPGIKVTPLSQEKDQL